MKYRYETNDDATYHLLLQQAKRMRSQPTEAERTLWKYLKGNQLRAHFRQQHPIFDYHLTEEQQRKDEERSRWLATKGFTILRFSNDDVFLRLHFVLDKIRNKMKENDNMPSVDNK